MSEDASSISRIASIRSRIPFRGVFRLLLSAVLIFVITVSATIVCRSDWIGEYGFYTRIGRAIAATDHTGWNISVQHPDTYWEWERPDLIELAAILEEGDFAENYPYPTLAAQYDEEYRPDCVSEYSSYRTVGIGMSFTPTPFWASLFLNHGWVVSSSILVLCLLHGPRFIRRLR